MVLTSIINPNESLARFIKEKSGYFSVEKNSVLSKTFMPHAQSLTLSVFRIDGLKLEEVWEIGQREVIDISPEPKTLLGMADIKASKVRECGLEIAATDTPPRHADIYGWPEKAKCKSIALQLAAEAKLILK